MFAKHFVPGLKPPPETPLTLQALGCGRPSPVQEPEGRGRPQASVLQRHPPRPEAEDLLSSAPGGRSPGQPPPPPAPSAQEAPPRGPDRLAGSRARRRHEHTKETALAGNKNLAGASPERPAQASAPGRPARLPE